MLRLRDVILLMASIGYKIELSYACKALIITVSHGIAWMNHCVMLEDLWMHTRPEDYLIIELNYMRETIRRSTRYE